MRRLTKIIIFAATVVLSGVGLAGPSATPARASAIQGFVLQVDLFFVQGDAETCLYAHAHNYPIQVTQDQDECTQWWSFTNRENETLPDNDGVETAWEIQLTDSGQCVNDFEHTYYLDSCQPGDTSELFWQTPPSGAGSVFTYANVAASIAATNGDIVSTFEYMSAQGTSGNVVDEDSNLFDTWLRTCVLNC
jgi:hypothetical protein